MGKLTIDAIGTDPDDEAPWTTEQLRHQSGAVRTSFCPQFRCLIVSAGRLALRSGSITFRARLDDKSDDTDDVFEHMPPRRKRSTHMQVKEKENLDELILVWQPVGAGALKISLGDLRRLTPGEFLNDNIIEFGLQYWLHSLRIMHNPIAEDIHVFSSFFYKKLNQKNFEQGYQSVRTWTKNVDIFRKKYIIVPINEHMHWYLAIIYRPEFVLRPPPPKDEPSRLSTRILAHLQKDSAQHAQSAVGTAPGASSATVQVRDRDAVSLSEVEQVSKGVDVDAYSQRVPSCAEHNSVDDYRFGADPMSPGRDEDAQDEAPMLVTDDDDDAHMAEGAELILRERSISLGSGQPPILDRAVPPSVTDSANLAASLTPVALDSVSDMEIAESETEVEEADDLMKMSYVFLFDSLGGRHPQAIKNLQNYLVAEAKDKRKIPRDHTSVPEGKKVAVPTQPNYCDCGLYLLHFVETFIRESEKFTRAILTPGRKLRNKNVLWHNQEVPDKRSHLHKVILMLSNEWKETKVEEGARARPTAPEQDMEDSDDEIICVKPVVAPKQPIRNASRVSLRK